MSGCPAAQLLIGPTETKCYEQPLTTNVTWLDLLLYDYSIEAEPKACMGTLWIDPWKRACDPEKWSGSHVWDRLRARIYNLGPNWNDIVGGALYFDKQSAHVPH